MNDIRKGPIVVINSCFKYYTSTTPLLLASLDAANVPRSAIHIIVGECDDSLCKDDIYMGVHIHFVPYANIDNNAFLWLVENDGYVKQNGLDNIWAFYLHDTCTVEDEFWKNINATVNDDDFRSKYLAARIHQPFSMCIGLYSVCALRRPSISGRILSLKNTDRSPKTILNIKHDMPRLEDYVFRLLQDEGNVWTYPNVYNRVQDNVQMYGTTTNRICELYPHPGVRKWKGNWGCAPLHTNL